MITIDKVAAIYARVSTKEQTLGYSLDEQKHRCKEYIKNLGIKYHRVYIDDGHSGKTLDRPAMQRLIGDIIEGKISHIVVWKLDRLSRSLTDSLLFVEDLTNAGIEVISVTEDIDTSTTIGKIVISVLSGFSQIEIEKISERVKMGLNARFRDMKWHGGPPYGYDYDQKTGKLKINPNESKVVSAIFDKYLEYNSLGEVRKYLIKKKVPTRNGNGWRNNTVGVILSRTTYIGYMKRGDTEIECPELKIIDEQIFNEAQKIRESRAELSPGFGRSKEEVYY
ncbi:MAG: hypothetical protein A7315_07840 [Candidatus Altiarchaeales archaeon WOR_SM1_79]|jgi:site-specific DNA recombinase|nr:MAG: hypothetical protein A7315_07840 [Candidatus Altiarchaeales archaeon WOR_SM1_79]